MAVVCGCVEHGGVRVRNDDHPRRVRAVVRMSDHEWQILPHHGRPAPTPERRRRLHPTDYPRPSDSFGENADSGFVGGRLGESDQPHSIVGTPPSTPVYHASLSWALWRTFSMSGRCASGSNLASLPRFSAITTSSR